MFNFPSVTDLSTAKVETLALYAKFTTLGVDKSVAEGKVRGPKRFCFPAFYPRSCLAPWVDLSVFPRSHFPETKIASLFYALDRSRRFYWKIGECKKSNLEPVFIHVLNASFAFTLKPSRSQQKRKC